MIGCGSVHEGVRFSSVQLTMFTDGKGTAAENKVKLSVQFKTTPFGVNYNRDEYEHRRCL